MAGHSRSKKRRRLLAYVPAIHAFVRRRVALFGLAAAVMARADDCGGITPALLLARHCEEQSDEAIRGGLHKRWIASLRSQ
jgi:hypothetical protein